MLFDEIYLQDRSAVKTPAFLLDETWISDIAIGESSPVSMFSRHDVHDRTSALEIDRQ
jgi:hypothetical protein